MLSRVGGWCARRHWVVIVLWLIAIVGLAIGAHARPGTPKDVFSVPGSESQSAIDLLNQEFPAANGLSTDVVFETGSGTIDDPAAKAAIETTVANLRKVAGPQGSVADPYQGMVTGLSFDQGKPVPVYQPITVNASRTVAYVPVSFPESYQSQEQAKHLFDQVEQAAQPAAQAGLTVEVGGPVASLGNPAPEGLAKYSEPLGILAAMVVLLFSFGSATSMAVPIGCALVAVFGVSNSALTVLESWPTTHPVGSAAGALGLMIGLGVAIDYGLFIVSRHRQNLQADVPMTESIEKSVATSGSAVLFAGIAVCLALGALALMNIPYVTTMGLVAVMFVAVSMMSALTLVPAVLGLIGPRIDTLRIHHRPDPSDTSKTFSARWAAQTARRPVVFAAIGIAIMVALIVPAKQMQLGFPDDGNQPTSLTQRHAYDTLAQNFGAGINAPLLIAVDLPGVSSADAPGLLEAFGKLSAAISAAPGVERVSLPLPNRFSLDPAPTAAILQVTPASGPEDPATKDLVEALRHDVIPKAVAGTALSPSQVYVGGSAPLLIDFSDTISSRLALYIGSVIGLTFVLLMMVFRSLAVPAQAAVMNLLSIAAAYGVLVLVFQKGWGMHLIALPTTLDIMAFVPVIMFAVLFGLSMDYQVFLLSRIREEWNRSGENRPSVVAGVVATARTITSAALIMIAVFLSFVPAEDPTTKMIAIGMASAVLIDATIVRMLLVPSAMELVGKANWWLPSWLDRILPHINLE